MFIYKGTKYSDSHVHSIQLDKCCICIQQNTEVLFFGKNKSEGILHTKPRYEAGIS